MSKQYKLDKDKLSSKEKVSAVQEEEILSAEGKENNHE